MFPIFFGAHTVETARAREGTHKCKVQEQAADPNELNDSADIKGLYWLGATVFFAFFGGRKGSKDN